MTRSRVPDVRPRTPIHVSLLRVLGERDAAIPHAMSKEFAGRAASVVRLDTSHSPFLSQPHQTAMLLRFELARARHT
jgi:mannitol/fructose-specific phosphotransferase system IIA component (Ntr-type)